VALAQNPANIRMPVAAADCSSRQVLDAVLPVLVDGALPHLQSQPLPGDQPIAVKIPNQNCTGCMLQVVEFMTPHAAPCFYYHCARVNVVGASGTGGGAGGGTAGGGATAGGSGTAGGGATAGGNNTAGGAPTAGGNNTAGGSSTAG